MIADMTAKHGYRLIPACFAVDSSDVLLKNTTRMSEAVGGQRPEAWSRVGHAKRIAG